MQKKNKIKTSVQKRCGHFDTLYINKIGIIITIVIIIITIIAGYVVRMEEGISAFRILTGKPTGKRPLRRPRRKQDDNYRKNLKEMGINTRS